MIATVSKFMILATLVALVPVAVSQGQPTPAVARQANALLRDGDAQAALALYGETTEDDSLSPLVAYDKSCVHLALGQVAEAEALLNIASHASTRDDVAAKARFNLGYLAFQEGSQAAQADPAAAIEIFQRSAQAFQASYDLDPTDPQTPRNIELARLAIKELKDRIAEQEKQEQEQQQQQDDLAEQLQNLANEQQALADESEEAASRDQTEEERAQNAHNINEKQSDLDKRTQEAKDALDAMQQQSPSDEARLASERVQQARERQDDAGQSLTEHSLEAAAAQQDEAAQLLRKAAEILKSQNEQQQPQDSDEDSEGDPQQEQESGQPPQGDEQERNAVEQMLQELLEKERQERENRQRGAVAKPGSNRPVKKDW